MPFKDKETQKKYLRDYQPNWIKEKTVSMCLRLNREHDADIIRHLEAQSNKQGYIKALLREKAREGKDEAHN